VRYKVLTREMFDTTIMRLGGTILGTTNKGDPFRFPMRDGSLQDLSEACQAAFNPAGGSGFEWLDLAVVAVWGLAGTLLAVRFFSWYPRD